jgi:outer membrane immunogenic protein
VKKLLLGSVAFLALAASPVSAADLGAAPGPYYKAPAFAPQYDWTGFYLGAHATYSWSHGHGQTEDTATGQEFAPGTSNTSAPHFGGQIGYDYMLPSRWVLGVVADINSGIDRTTTFTSANGKFQTENESDGIVSGTFRARAGYAFDTLLLYGTAGGTWNDANTTRTQLLGKSGNAGPGTVETVSTSRIGWTVGAGLDYAFARNWDVFAEYRYAGNSGTTTFPIAELSTNSSSTTNVVEVGVNYRFNYGR